MNKDFDIDKHDTRQQLAVDTPVESASTVPSGILDDSKATITIGNYIGWESREDGMPDLVPIMQALIYYASVIATEEHENRLLALARVGALIRSPHYVRNALQPAIVEVEKANGEYTLSKRQAFSVQRAIKSNKVIWGSPAQTTDDNGLKIRVKTGLVRFARKYETNLAILAVELDQNDLHLKIPKQLYIDQVEIPTIIYDPPVSSKNNEEVKLNKLANEAITLYLLAYVASLLPENQRGEFEHFAPDEMMRKQIWQLLGMQADGLYVSGGFLDKQLMPTHNTEEVEKTSFIQRMRDLVSRPTSKE